MSAITQAGVKQYPGKLTPFVLIACIVAAMGGLLFGCEIGIAGGVASTPVFVEKFSSMIVQEKTQFDAVLEFFQMKLYAPAAGGSIFASVPTMMVRRTSSMFLGAAFYCIGVMMSMISDFSMLNVGRVLVGFGVGFILQSVPLYLSEMAPHKLRGAFNAGFQLSITIGILVGNVLGDIFAKIDGHWGWRLSLGVAIIPALIILIGSWFLPDTPNSLIDRRMHDEAIAMLRRVRGVDDVEQEFDDLVAVIDASKKVKGPILMRRECTPYLVMLVAIALFQQLTGINVITLYAPILFRTIGFKDNASLMSAVIVGGVTVLATLLFIYGVDRWGRRFLFLQGGVQMFICQVVVAIFIGGKFGLSTNPSELPHWSAIVVVILMCIYISAFAWSWGPLGWLVPSEIFPIEIRSLAQSFSIMVNMFSFIFIADHETSQSMLYHFTFGVFIFFAFFVVVMSVFIYFFFPETKGVPIEEMNLVWKEHPFWAKYVSDDQLHPRTVDLEIGKNVG